MHTAELIEHNIHTLKESGMVLNNIAAEQYRHLVGSGRASIGKHIRHIIDHYLCLINGMTGGKIAYDDRIRDQRYETDLQIARQKIDQICMQLKSLKSESATNGAFPNRKIKVSCCTSVEQSEAIEVDSTLERELIFLQNHTVHHFSLIKMILQGQGVAVGEHFGIAPSTVKHIKYVGETVICHTYQGHLP